MELKRVRSSSFLEQTIGTDTSDTRDRPICIEDLEELVMPTAVKVRKETSADGSHRHIEGVCTADGTHYTRAQVAADIDRGVAWSSSGGGATATVRKITYCPAAACMATPYITTSPDYTTKNNLDDLPPC
jgi:hypothetical protein